MPCAWQLDSAQPLKSGQPVWRDPSTRLSPDSKESDVAVNLVTPEHPHYGSEAVLHSRNFGGTELMAILPAEGRLLDQIRSYLKTDLYIRQNTGGDDETLNAILSVRARQNTSRRQEINLQAAALWRDGPDGVVVLCRGDTTLCEIPAAEIQGAWGGLCRGTVIAAAFVAVMAERMGVAPNLIRERILDFDSSHNPGRSERIDTPGRSIVLSWAGTTETLQSISVLMESLNTKPNSRTRILLRLGFVAADHWMCSMAAEACRLFDVVRIARGEQDTGRVEEEAVAMILEAGYAADPGVDLRYVGEVHAAIPAFLKDAAPGDPVLVHALNVHTAKACILEWLHTESMGRSEVVGA